MSAASGTKRRTRAGGFAAPDSLVRSINEAVNYQFGFDLTSTWGYQLLVRSALKLVGTGLVVLLLGGPYLDSGA